MTSKAGYWLGGGVMIFAVIGGILWMVLSIAQEFREMENFQRVALPGTGTVELQARSYVVYVEGVGANVNPPEVDLVITDRAGDAPLPLRSYPGSFTYTGSTTGSALAVVVPPRAGTYEVRSSSSDAPSGSMLALGEGAGPEVGVVLLAAAAVASLFFAGFALAIVTAVRRAKRRPPPPPTAWGAWGA